MGEYYENEQRNQKERSFFDMAIRVGVGKSDFDDLRSAGNYYVDKTEFIYELVEKTDNKVTLFTRPRRFGKTLMMSMLENFFSVRLDSKEAFEGLNITRHVTFCEKWMNKYPVLFISFKDIEGLTFESAYKMLQTRIADVCKKIADLTEEKGINRYDVELFDRLQSKAADEDEVNNSLKTIMRIMHAVYGKKVILLIDEYDVPLAKANEGGGIKNVYYEKMLGVIRGIMGTALKDNEYLQFAVITGCLRIAKESIFTGTNNFASYSVLDKRFSGYFGFTEAEMRELLKDAELQDKADLIREWYDGYVFGNSCVYCPWDVINYISNLMNDEEQEPDNYWKNTSHNGILLTFVERTDFHVEGKFEILMNGGTITQNIVDDLTYDTLHSSENNLWSVLLMTGYLTKADPKAGKKEVELKIPNREIATIFEDTVAIYFTDTLDKGMQKAMVQALWDGDEEAAARSISELLWKTISYHDYHEDYYHAFLAGAFVGLGYEVDSNKESGLGRADLILKDRSNRRAVIIETKRSVRESDMEKDCMAAKDQIVRQKYAQGLNGYEQILRYGVAFFQKKALVRRLTDTVNLR